MPATPVAESNWDVVIVGSGVAGALAGARLAMVGLRVVILEAGPRTDRATGVQRLHLGLYPYESPEWAPQPAGTDVNTYFVQGGAIPWTSDYEKRVGGTTWHWLGNSPRLLPSDFEMQTRYGVGADWPLTYDDLEPWYGLAEHEMGVAGDSENDHGSPRSGPYPMPALPLSTGDELFKTAAAKLGYDVVATPQARNSVDGYGGRSICCGNGTCIPICPVQAKYDATVHVALAEAHGAEVIDNATVFNIEVGAEGLVTAVHYRTPDRQDHAITGKAYLIAANGIETPKLLLISTGEQTPNGVANSSDQVGRNLSDHPATLTLATLPEPYAGGRGPLQLAGIDSTREGDGRGERSAFRFEVFNDTGNPLNIARDLITQGMSGKELFESIRAIAPYQVGVASLSEQLPDPENRVVPDLDQLDALGIPRPKLVYSHADYSLDGLQEARAFHHELLESMGGTNLWDSGIYGVGHLMGTCRMGEDPATSVTDATGRTHDHPNLYLAGSSLFPTSGTANPTLTLAALALRTADVIGEELGVEMPGATATPMVATPVAG
jgi:choline dehydrogenase-like flavoprotein